MAWGQKKSGGGAGRLALILSILALLVGGALLLRGRPVRGSGSRRRRGTRRHAECERRRRGYPDRGIDRLGRPETAQRHAQREAWAYLPWLVRVRAASLDAPPGAVIRSNPRLLEVAARA